MDFRNYHRDSTKKENYTFTLKEHSEKTVGCFPRCCIGIATAGVVVVCLAAFGIYKITQITKIHENQEALTSGISVNVDPDKPALGNSMTVTCQRSSSSSASITWSVGSSFLTTCDGSTNDFCAPPPTGYTFSTNVSANEFNLTLASITIADCKTYACADTGNSETISKNIQLAYYSKNDITQTEPGANTDGSISITTGCVLSPDDLSITWSKIVNGNSVALSTGDPSPVTSTDRSTCTRTCHTEEDKKVTSGFTHTEYTGTDSETFQYMVTASHSSYPDNADIFTWTSANYNQKKATRLTVDVSSTSTSTTATFITTAAPSSISSSTLTNTSSTPVTKQEN